jgi:hypothetical protein
MFIPQVTGEADTQGNRQKKDERKHKEKNLECQLEGGSDLFHGQLAVLLAVHEWRQLNGVGRTAHYPCTAARPPADEAFRPL